MAKKNNKQSTKAAKVIEAIEEIEEIEMAEETAEDIVEEIENEVEEELAGLESAEDDVCGFEEAYEEVTASVKKDSGKVIIDVITVLMLVVAFGMAYYTGFVGRNYMGEPMLPTNILAIVGSVGMLILLIVGGIGELTTRVKCNLVTKHFVAFLCVQVFFTVTMAAAMVALVTEFFTLDSVVVKTMYIASALVGILGYADSIMFTYAYERKYADAAKETEEEAEEDEE